MNNWLTSTFQSVREKSLDAIEIVRKDLSDFTSTVKNDTENYLNKINCQPGRDFGIHRIVSRLSQTGIAENENGKHLAASASFDRLQKERLRLQNDEATYLTDPTPIEAYETSDFNVEECKGEIAQLLIDAPHVRSMYARLVPACTTHSDFWSRYYFRLHQFDEEERRRMNLLKRAHEICNETHGNDWEDPDDEWSKEISQTPVVSITSEEKENDTTGDSWEHEFDQTDLTTSTNNTIPLDSLQENSVLSGTVTKKADNEFDDEWESWS